MASTLFASIGTSNLWGFSAAFDCVSFCSLDSSDDNQELHILLINPGDIRHILNTVSKRNRNGHASERVNSINFYIIESDSETLCREILLLASALDHDLPIRQRANLFLEIYGNCKVQERTSRYIESIGQVLSKLVTNNVGSLKGILDFSLLKHRERDDLESVLRSYKHIVGQNSNSVYDIDKLRDFRLRGYFAERYDNRKELSDWDYQYSLKGTSADIIHLKQFKEWRMTGIAFEFGDQQYTESNRTMLSYAEGVVKTGRDQGMKKEVKGFWGDIVASPFYSFGIDTEVCGNSYTEGLFEIVNKDTGTEQHRHHTVEVALHTLFCYLWEMETGQPYNMAKANDIYSGFGLSTESDINVNTSSSSSVDIMELLDDNVDNNNNNNNNNNRVEKNHQIGDKEISSSSSSQQQSLTEMSVNSLSTPIVEPSINNCWGNVKIYPIMGSFTHELSKSKFDHRFDMIFISCRSAHLLESPILNKILKPNSGRVVVETAKHLVNLTHVQRDSFTMKLNEYATAQGFQKIPQPIPSRRRDEKDTKDEILVWQNL